MRPVGKTAIAIACAVVSMWAAGAQAAGDPLTRARQELDALQYDKARASLDEALKQGTNGPRDMAEIYRLSGQVAAALGDAAGAEDDFKMLLELAPDAQLPAGMSPKITEPFDAARAFAKQHAPLAITHTESGGAAPTITLVVANDALGLVAGARAIVSADGGPARSLEARGGSEILIPLPAGHRLEVTLAAIDSRGNRLVEIGVDEPIVIGGPTEIVKPVHRAGGGGHARPIYARWWLWGGVALAVGGGATYFGLDALDAQKTLDDLNRNSAMHDFSEAKKVEDRGRQSALLANVGFGVAGGFAVLSVILLVTDHHGHGGEQHTIVTPTADGGAALLLVGSF